MLFCSKCGKQAEDSWNYCPMDATPLKNINPNNFNSNNGMAKIHNPYINNNAYQNSNNANPIQNPYLNTNAVNIQQLIVKPCGRCKGKGRMTFGEMCPVCKIKQISVLVF